jgi:hypothetical protein
MTAIAAETLSPSAVAMLGQLYVSGPTWDGNVLSKPGRGELVKAGLAFHEHGYAFLTSDGVRLAAEWAIWDLRARNEDRWIEKRRKS